MASEDDDECNEGKRTLGLNIMRRFRL